MKARAETEGLNEIWESLVDDQTWPLYQSVIEGAQREGIPFAVGGGLALSVYARRARKGKDVDLYVLPRDRDRMVALIERLGFADHFAHKPYDRKWIFRGTRGGVVVDVMWQMANYKAAVDRDWLERGPWIELKGSRFAILPIEELIWSKLHVVQRERCDWPDLLRVLYCNAGSVDWRTLLRRVAEDRRLLGGLLCTLSWLSPHQARTIPRWVWYAVGVRPPTGELTPEEQRRRIAELDSRDWFGAYPPP